MQDHAKNIGDVAAASIMVATLFQWLPALAALLTIVYTTLRIVEWVNKKQWKQDTK